MKNNFWKVFACLSFSFVLAESAKAEEDILQVTPFATTAGITENE